MTKDDQGLPLKHKLSENTLNRSVSGFKKFNIMENNAIRGDDKVTRRRSIIQNNEYDASAIFDGSVKDDSSETDSFEENRTVDNTKVKIHVKKSKVRFSKDGKMRSNFTDLTFLPRETIFDSEIKYGTKFFGFYVAIWICVFFFGLNVVFGNKTARRNIFQGEIMHLMLKDIFKVAFLDLLIYLSMYFSVFIQLAIKKGWISWKYTGVTIQSIYEVMLLWLPSHLSNALDFPWIAQIFLMLHSCVMLMKVHSYSFFNGYLWEITEELKFSTLYTQKREILTKDVEDALNNSIKFCESEIKLQNFPNNISFYDFFQYSMFPVLVYQTSYPRNDRIRLSYLFKKISGIFGVIILMIAIAQNNLYPLVMQCLDIQANLSYFDRVKTYPFILIEVIPSFLAIYLLTFYLIWDLILNAIAELSRFADREFYRYWWNSVDWNEYARDWNVPVHKFLLRHVYHSSISALNVNKTAATFLTFFFSSIVHEFAMYVIFKKIRFYLLLLQMSQLVLVQISRTKWMRDKYVLGNCIFWFGIVFGPSLMCTMYLAF